MLRYLKRLVGERDAEDLTQLVMVKVSDGLARFRGDSQLTTWIYRIAEHQVPSTEATAIRDEMNACVREFVERLPDPYRAVIVLSAMEGFKNREIAEILGQSLDTVKIRLHRAREKLKQDLVAGCTFQRDERNEFACDRKPSTPSSTS